MYEIPLALARLLGEFGGEVRTGALVEEIMVRGDRVAGVRLAGGTTLAADVVVCNADLPYSYRTLVPERYRAPYQHGRLDRLRHGCSAFMLYLGVDRRYEQLFHHNVFLSRDPADNFADIFQRFRLPSDPSFYVHCGARTDPGVASPGRDALFILAPVPHLHPGIDWVTEAPRYRELMLDRLEAVAAPEVRRHIVAERMVTPVEWGAQYNLYHGATFGLSHDFFQVGYMRPRNKAAALEGLYFAGASTVPGGGVPMVLISSRLVAQRVQREVWHA
jgi:phytoene desaturase